MKNTINTTVNSVEERDKLLAQLNAMTFKEEAVKKWEDLENISGYYVADNSRIRKADTVPLEDNRNVFATEQQAESMLAYAQLTQLMKQVNGDWEPDWDDNDTKNYVIEYYADKLRVDWCFTEFNFIAFPTPEIRDEFLINHRELLETFYMIKK